MHRHFRSSLSGRLALRLDRLSGQHRFKDAAKAVTIATIAVSSLIGTGCSNSDSVSEAGRQSTASTTSTSTDTPKPSDSAGGSDQTANLNPPQTTTSNGNFTLLAGSLGANMFDNINATGDPTRIPPWTKVHVRCRIPVPADAGESIKPYWYQLADPVFEGYAPSNSFWWSGTEAEPVEQDHRDYDGRVPVCDDLPTANS